MTEEEINAISALDRGLRFNNPGDVRVFFWKTDHEMIVVIFCFIVPRRPLHLCLNGKLQVKNFNMSKSKQSQEARCLLVINEVIRILYKVNSNREYECMINELVDLGLQASRLRRSSRLGITRNRGQDIYLY